MFILKKFSWSSEGCGSFCSRTTQSHSTEHVSLNSSSFHWLPFVDSSLLELHPFLGSKLHLLPTLSYHVSNSDDSGRQNGASLPVSALPRSKPTHCRYGGLPADRGAL